MNNNAVKVILALAFVGGLVYIGITKKRGEGQADNTVPKSGGFKVVSSASGGNRVLIEAESAVEIEKPIVISEAGNVASGASCGKSCYLGPEKVNEKPEIRQFKKGHPLANHPGYAKYVFTVPETDDYALWLRAYWVDDCGDSVSISVNASSPRTLSGSTYKRWMWNLFRTGSGQAARIHLEKGKQHTLVICNREDDLYFDQILLLGKDREWPDPISIEK